MGILWRLAMWQQSSSSSSSVSKLQVAASKWRYLLLTERNTNESTVKEWHWVTFYTASLLTRWISSSRSRSFCPVNFIGKSVRGSSTLSRYCPCEEPTSPGCVVPSAERTLWQPRWVKESAGWSPAPLRRADDPHLATVRLTAEARHSNIGWWSNQSCPM